MTEEEMKSKIEQLSKEIASKDAILHQKNLELDALGHVWCSGGCNGGIFRYGVPPTSTDLKITEEQISIVERNTIRLRHWFEARQCHISQKTGKKIEKCDTCSSLSVCDGIRSKAVSR